MYAVRLSSVPHARLLSGVYAAFERVLRAADPLLRRIGHRRLEAPVAAVERGVKGILFDCRMCGQCTLGSTGLACPMNCPKSLRNGPCGGVRPDGMCEVVPAMRCVWVRRGAAAGSCPMAMRSWRCSSRSTTACGAAPAWLGVLRAGPAARAGR